MNTTWTLPVIIISQFCCTSLWFASNGVMNDLVSTFQLAPGALSHLTSVVQLGFISGTLVFALLTVADRYSPSTVFCWSALVGALFNLGPILESNSFASLLIYRYLTGFFLAGIYPVGMKIAADYYQKGLGRSLGFLVGALAVGTAFPHLIKGFTGDLPWRSVLILTSAIACIGGLMMLIMVPDGPYRRPSDKLDLTAFFKVFRNSSFKAAAFGYFGHMWEVYTFWAFLPIILDTYGQLNPSAHFNIPIISFLVIGLGSLGCIIGGYLSNLAGTKKTAALALFLSGLCCLISPLVFHVDSPGIFIGYLIFWGLVVIADSPLFSTLVAHNASADMKGTGLTIVNCIGFSVTIISLQLINLLQNLMDPRFIYVLLALGPIAGLSALYSNQKPPAFD